MSITLKELLAYSITALFVLLVLSLILWVLRLHLDQKYKEFDLTKLVMHPDRSPDAEKIRMWSTYLAGLYAFLHLMINDHATFAAYGPWFIGFVLAHLVANRITAKPSNGLTEKPS